MKRKQLEELVRMITHSVLKEVIGSNALSSTDNSNSTDQTSIDNTTISKDQLSASEQARIKRDAEAKRKAEEDELKQKQITDKKKRDYFNQEIKVLNRQTIPNTADALKSVRHAKNI